MIGSAYCTPSETRFSRVAFASSDLAARRPTPSLHSLLLSSRSFVRSRLEHDERCSQFALPRSRLPHPCREPSSQNGPRMSPGPIVRPPEPSWGDLLRNLLEHLTPRFCLYASNRPRISNLDRSAPTSRLGSAPLEANSPAVCHSAPLVTRPLHFLRSFVALSSFMHPLT